MPGQEWGVLGGYPAKFEFWPEGKLGAGLGVELGGVDRGALVVEGHEALVEEGVEVGAEEEAVEDVEALLVGLALGPGFGVAGAKEFGNGDAGNRTGSAPVIH